MGKSAVKKMFVRISQRMENFRLRNVHCCHTPPLQKQCIEIWNDLCSSRCWCPQFHIKNTELYLNLCIQVSKVQILVCGIDSGSPLQSSVV